MFESSEIFLDFVLLLSASVKLLQPDHFRSEVFFKFNGFQLRINAYVVIFFQSKFIRYTNWCNNGFQIDATSVVSSYQPWICSLAPPRNTTKLRVNKGPHQSIMDNLCHIYFISWLIWNELAYWWLFWPLAKFYRSRCSSFTWWFIIAYGSI